MAHDEVDIYNLALNAVGTRSNVSSPTEQTREAEVCSLWFGPVMDQVLSAARWPMARTVSRLALLAERDQSEEWVSGDPEPGFRYAYALPADFVYPQYLNGFDRFIMGSRNGARALMAQQEDALLVYTRRVRNTSLWDPDARMAFVYALAAHIAMPLHGKASRARAAQEQANELIMQARTNAANMDVDQYDVLPEWISARGYSGSTAASQRYIHPYGSLFSIPELSR